MWYIISIYHIIIYNSPLSIIHHKYVINHKNYKTDHCVGFILFIYIFDLLFCYIHFAIINDNELNAVWTKWLPFYIHKLQMHFLNQTLSDGLYCSKHSNILNSKSQLHDDVIKWKHFLCYWLFVRGIHRWPVNSPHKGQWHGALMFSLICAWIMVE